MDLQKDAIIVTHDGHEVGHLDRVAINPRSKEVTHLVVRRGKLFPVDKVIEMMYVAEATPERITLTPDLGDPEYLPPFEVKYYVGTNAPAPRDGGLGRLFAPRGYWTAPGGQLGGLGGVPVRGVPDSPTPLPDLPTPDSEVELERNVPDTTVALKKGAEVVDEDGQSVGSVVQVVMDEATGRATHFLVSTGGAERKAVPTHWLGEVSERVVNLLVGADVVAQLPDHATAER